VLPRRAIPVAVAILGLSAAAPAVAHAATAPPTVTQSGNDFTVSLAGIGSVTVSVDPATGAVSNVVATADPTGGFTAGAPSVVDEGVQLTFTPATTGPPQVLQVEVEREDGVVSVKAETGTRGPGDAVEPDDGNEPGHAAASTSSTSTTEVEHEGDDDAGRGSVPEVEHDAPTTPGAATPTTTEAEHGSSGSSRHDEGSSDGGRDGASSADGGD